MLYIRRALDFVIEVAVAIVVAAVAAVAVAIVAVVCVVAAMAVAAPAIIAASANGTMVPGTSSMVAILLSRHVYLGANIYCSFRRVH